MSDQVVRTALIGYGLGGRVIHRPLLVAEPRIEVTHVVTADPGRREHAAADLPAARLVDRAEELWTMAGDLDAVVIASPHRTHVPLALAALELGLPTVVDKPLALSALEVQLLLDRAAAVPLSVFHNRRWGSDTLTAAALLAAGTLGEVHRMESRFTRFRPEPMTRWREDAAEGGGVLLDLGSHLVDQALHLLGPAVDVYAEVDTRRPGAAADDDVFLALTHISGARSHLWASMAAPIAGPRLLLQGIAGGWSKQALDGQEDAQRRGLATGPEPDGVLVTVAGEQSCPSLPGDWRAFYRAWCAAVLDGAPVPVDPADALAVLRVLDAATQSAHHRDVVPL